MTLSLNKPKLDNLANEIWKSAERLRGKSKAYEYQGVILPIIVIRRLECVLLTWREAKSAEVLAKRPKLTEKELAKLVKELELNPKQSPFSNSTEWTLRKVLEEDPALLEKNFRAYINGFSKNIDDIIEHFNYRATIGTMVKNNRLAPILNQYKELALGPEQLSGLEMGYIYEELLRRFSEQSGEEARDHFTPREVIRLMVELLEIPIPDRHFSIYDPAGGTGGMLKRAQIEQLRACPWVKENRNCLIKGPTGCGKTFLACALGAQACREGHRTLYFYAPKFFRTLEMARAEGSLLPLLKKWSRAPLVIVDDLGIASVPEKLYREFLEMLDDRQGQGATLITSQFPVNQWHEVIADPTVADAILDRLVHNAYRIELKGESMRKGKTPLSENEN